MTTETYETYEPPSIVEIDPADIVPAPLPVMTDDEIHAAARDIITNQTMLASAQDRDWAASLALILATWKDIPINASTFFLVPIAPHMGGRWLNGRVPGVTLEARCVPLQNVDALYAKLAELTQVLYPAD